MAICKDERTATAMVKAGIVDVLQGLSDYWQRVITRFHYFPHVEFSPRNDYFPREMSIFSQVKIEILSPRKSQITPQMNWGLWS